MKWLSTIFLLLLTLNGFTQSELKEAMGLQYSNPDSAIVLATAIAEKTHDAKLKGNAWEVVGISYWVKQEYGSAILAHEKALEIRTHLSDQRSIGYSYNNLGLNYQGLGDLLKTNDLYSKGLEIAENLSDTSLMMLLMGNLGIVLGEIGYPEKAIKYYQTSLDIAHRRFDRRVEANIHNNIALVSHHLERPEDELNHARIALKIRESINDSLGIAQSLSLLGHIYDDEEKFDLADSCLIRSIGIYQRLNDKAGEALATLRLGHSLLAQGNTKEAKDKCQLAFQLSQKYNLDTKLTASKYLARANGSLGNAKEAERYWKMAFALKDSLSNLDKTAEIIRQNSLHEFELEQYKRQQEAERLQREVEFFERRDRILHYSAILIFMLAFFWLILYLSRRKVNAKLLAGSIFFFFLITFEFTLMFLDPLVSQASDNLPIFKLMMNAGIALLFIPLNSYLEKRLKKKLIGNAD